MGEGRRKSQDLETSSSDPLPIPVPAPTQSAREERVLGWERVARVGRAQLEMCPPTGRPAERKGKDRRWASGAVSLAGGPSPCR